MHARTRIAVSLAAGLAVAAGALPAAQAVAAPRPAAAAHCATRWGTNAKSASHAEGPRTARVTGARAGRHTCFERLVIDLTAGQVPGYRVHYVRAVRAQGSGNVIPLRGHAKLLISLTANAAAGFPGPGHKVASVAGFLELRQVVSAGSFEGYTDIGVGLRSKEPFRVTIVKGPGSHSRLVIDVATR